MYWLVENKKQFNTFVNVVKNDLYIEIIPDFYNEHPCQQSIVGYYVRPITDKKGYILPVNHYETSNLQESDVINFLNGISKFYCYDKKKLLHNFKHRNLFDIQINYKEIQTDYPLIIQDFQRRKISNSNCPIVKIYEYYEAKYEEISEHIDNDYNLFYNNKVPLVFSVIESSGIKINKQLFEKHFYENEEDFVFTQYNYTTLTTRPSNTFKKVNYAALNKDNGSRDCFIPRNDHFVEIDVSSYHILLLCQLLNYEFEVEDIHQYFASVYQTSYDKAKQLTFQQIYGGIKSEYEHIPFFQKVKNYSNNLWSEFNSKGYIECPISNYRFSMKDHPQMNSLKLMNYLLQNLETSNNVLILYDILKLLRGKQTKVVLYTYDSILLDVDKKEEEIVEKIKEVFRIFNLKIKCKNGKNYGNLVKC